MSLDAVDLQEYMREGFKYKGLKQIAYDKLFKILSTGEDLAKVHLTRQKFMTLNEKRKKTHAKMSRKNLIQFIQKLY